MPYISSVERIGYNRGWNAGETEGITQGRIEAIELGLSLKFGDDAALSLMPLIRSLHDPDRLIMIKDAIRAVGGIKEIRQLVLGKQGQA